MERSAKQKYLDENCLLIYQMGKVGSTSLHYSLPDAIHFHTLYDQLLCPVIDLLKPKSAYQKLKRERQLRKIRRRIKKRKTIKIITMVRDPFEKNKSQFFQDLPYWLSYAGLYLRRETRDEGKDFVYDAFTNAFNHDLVSNWFDDEFRRFTNIDIYQEPFNKEQGYTIIKKGAFEIFLYKLEKVNDILPRLSEFCKVDIELKSTNRGERKWYADVYKDFIENHVPSREHLDFLYQSKLTRHFYTEAEIQGFYDKHLS